MSVRVDRGRARRAAVLLGAAGAFLVLLAIPTDSRPIVAVGLVLVVVAHVLLFVGDVTPPWSRRR